MSTTNKTVIGIVVVAVIALVALFALRAHGPEQARNDDSSLPTSASDTSDAALAKDSAAVDAQLSGLDSDTAAADQGVVESQI